MPLGLCIGVGCDGGKFGVRVSNVCRVGTVVCAAVPRGLAVGVAEIDLGKLTFVCALHVVSPRGRWLCVLP